MVRIINLDGGNYIQNVAGDYIQGDLVLKDDLEEQEITTIYVNAELLKDDATTDNSIHTNGANYTETLHGEFIDGDVFE